MAKISASEAKIIEAAPLFRDLTRQQIDDIVAAANLLKIKKNGILFHQSDPAHSTFVIINGRVKLTQLTADGAQTLLRVVGPGQILAVVSALEVMNYPATATAERDSRLLSWDGKTLDRLFFKHPGLSRNALAILSARMREMQERFGELASQRTERRLARALLRLADQVGKKESDGVVLDMALSRQDLAEMIGTTLFSVSRILTDWQARKLVNIGRRKVILRDPERLAHIAEELAH